MSRNVRIEIVSETKEFHEIILNYLKGQGFDSDDIYFNDEIDNLICVVGSAAYSFDLEKALKSLHPEISGIEYKLWDLDREPDQEGEF